jgi:ADP-heptose:LPS heptosyltransferase
MNLALAEYLGAAPCPTERWRFPLPRASEDDAYVAARLAALGAREFLILNPGGGWKSKRWPPENYAQLIRHLRTEIPWKILLTGSPDEEGLIQEILKLAATPSACYFPSTLVQFIALARRACLFVGGDTGPMHLAAAVGTPIVAIFSASDPLNTPERNGPFARADIVVSDCTERIPRRRGKRREYLQGVSVDAVLAAIRARLARVNG